MSGGSAIEKAIAGANKVVMNEIVPLTQEQAVELAQELMERTEIVMVGSHGAHGYPNIKAMFKHGAQGVRNVYFSTNTSSRRVAQFADNPKACVYVFDPDRFAGAMLVGTMEIVLDPEVKRQLWRQGWEAYYPLGITDPEYCVLRFTAVWGNFYHGLQNVSFEIN